jgi:hypothetical protein
VREDVVDALGAHDPANRARTKVVITVAAGGGTVEIDRLEEHPLPDDGADWVELSTSALDHSVTIAGFTSPATLTTATAPATALGAGSTLEVRCYADGRCDGLTLYLEGERGQRNARVAVMPLGGSPVTLEGW